MKSPIIEESMSVTTGKIRVFVTAYGSLYEAILRWTKYDGGTPAEVIIVFSKTLLSKFKMNKFSDKYCFGSLINYLWLVSWYFIFLFVTIQFIKS